MIRGGGSDSDTDLPEEKAQHDDNPSSSSSSSNAVSKSMYNKQASNWVRTEPRCLSDFTGRPVVFDLISAELQHQQQQQQDTTTTPTSTSTVLDVGCGEGYCARKVIELGAQKVIGSDISQEMIHSAIATSDGDPRFKFYSEGCSGLLSGMNERCDYLGIDQAEESVDVAMAVFLFNYLTTVEMQDAMQQIYTALKPGGAFIFSVPHPSMIFCHGKDAIFRLESEGKGYFSSRNEKILGQICTIDGTRLNIMSVHKTVNDYIEGIQKAGFQIEVMREVGVTEEHMKMNHDFFKSVQDRPLHLVFQLRKPNL